ncbi:hypothetical protein SASPL_138757 [Salvia splendens]|uniref:Myb/SANT-like domain-containing protein n=1 Tax=Salvia splendens TaxID=180675 RepID=A0A8X8WX85_SALSN|nr:uncharacterized protein LOC121763712 [Salvia splendens]XP_042015707.1 uncharacterized protein LOC121763712 [Salvia splendens]XP_042015708.1 uncharacterized protein LOC121763712 [Salvia splendens]KAG6401889.1 hypothetical protein SASPL_138757 [Salvia splendens]
MELVARGRKLDNGFRAGYLTKIEDSLRAEFPNTDLKGTPHRNSKISAWKKSYGLLRNILSRSGVGFNNDGEYKIDCSDDQWDQIVKADKDTKFMRTKSWTLWETWKFIFGKDRAYGGGVENIDAAAVRLRAQMSVESECNENDYHPSFEDFISNPNTPMADHDFHDTSSGNLGKQTSTDRTSPKKRKKMSRDSDLMEFLGNLHAETNTRLDKISNRIGHEFDMAKAREEVFAKLGTVDRRTLDQTYDLCNILGDKPQRLEVFNGMPPMQDLGISYALFSTSVVLFEWVMVVLAYVIYSY